MNEDRSGKTGLETITATVLLPQQPKQAYYVTAVTAVRAPVSATLAKELIIVLITYECNGDMSTTRPCLITLPLTTGHFSHWQGSYRFLTSNFKDFSQTVQRPKSDFQRPVLLISSSKINLKYDIFFTKQQQQINDIRFSFSKIPSLLIQSTILH